MYTRPKRNSSDEQSVAVTYSMEVMKDGKANKVPDAFAFHKGDNVRVHVQSNTDGYLYILASGAEGGQFDLIGPDSDGEGFNLAKGQDYRLPKQGMKIADNRALKLVFSKTKLAMANRAYSIIGGVVAADSIASAISGSVVLTKPASFETEAAHTFKLDETDKPLGIEIQLNTEASSSTAKPSDKPAAAAKSSSSSSNVNSGSSTSSSSPAAPPSDKPTK
jgi:hypothetical protein